MISAYREASIARANNLAQEHSHAVAASTRIWEVAIQRRVYVWVEADATITHTQHQCCAAGRLADTSWPLQDLLDKSEASSFVSLSD